MHRRTLVVLLAATAAGCSSQSGEPTATPTPEQTGTPTASTTDTGPGSPTDTATETATTTPTDQPGSEGGVDAIVADLNTVYAALEPPLDSLDVSGVDTDALTRRLETVRTGIESQRDAGTVDGDRLQTLSDVRWIFDRLVRTFAWFDEAYGIHDDLDAAYRANEATEETAAQVDRLRTVAGEAGRASAAAVGRYDAVDSFDPALDVDYAAFEDPLFRVNDTAETLTPFARGLEAAIPGRAQYRRAITTYDDGSYREAQNTFADLVSTFSDAIDRFERADAISGPLEAPQGRYLCEADASRLACVDYRAACREQLDDNPDRAERRRTQADQRLSVCS
jgi:hypothetical protein